jgi:predicted dehydrogenase
VDNSMRKIRVAVVGAGQFGRNHLRVLAECPAAELVAVVDRDLARAEQAAATYGCAAFSDVRRLAGVAEAAIVATPTTSHAEVGCALLEAGLDVLVEKAHCSRSGVRSEAGGYGRAGRTRAASRPPGAL